LAEIHDDDIQQIDVVMRDLMLKGRVVKEELKEEDQLKRLVYEEKKAKDFGKYGAEGKKLNKLSKKKSSDREALQISFVKLPIIAEELTEEHKKYLKARARKIYFGRVGSLWERAHRFFKNTYSVAPDSSETKMKFFFQELKNNLWFGLLAKTSKIAPRHVRVTLWYLYIAQHLLISSLIYVIGIQRRVFPVSMDLLHWSGTAHAAMFGAWPLGIIVALIFRMPMDSRRLIEGVRMKKLNKAFRAVDETMGMRYSLGYFVSLLVYSMMTCVVLFFNFFYPGWYVMHWIYCLVLLYLLDMLAYTFAFAAF